MERLGGKIFRANLANGFDLNKRRDLEHLKQLAREKRPREAWISLPCTVWSTLQNLNKHKHTEKFQKRLAEARRMIRLTIELVRVLIEVGCDVAWEHPLRARSWGLEEVINMCTKLVPHKSRTDGCCWGMRTVDTKELILKSWRIQCTTEEQAQRLNRTCQGNHIHAPIEGTARVSGTSYYPGAMARKWAKGVMRPKNFDTDRLFVMETSEDRSVLAVERTSILRKTDDEPSKKGNIVKANELIARIHRNAGHCSNTTLARRLKDDGAPKWVVELASNPDLPKAVN